MRREWAPWVLWCITSRNQKDFNPFLTTKCFTGSAAVRASHAFGELPKSPFQKKAPHKVLWLAGPAALGGVCPFLLFPCEVWHLAKGCVVLSDLKRILFCVRYHSA